ncbi:nucleoside hydrolase [Flavobacteriaceae bacterium TP-CH-4]|uniref:Nucleoside hydrolase n=1 Tax=Pelagihabitans pacificus TaxID=2696054 RepID=A0A967AWU6_9FLAO|nr:nucleoside hydrolase [Pelagihabitans pacificus]NHF60595.1 nucleoside hydrolase [Pelagihabitans pacificus]
MKVFSIPMAVSLLFLCSISCKNQSQRIEKHLANTTTDNKIKLIFDTDANNELDDQHALAYMLLNGNTFDVVGITVNATINGKGIQGHYDEAERILQLCNLKDSVPLLKGAEGNFKEISEDFDPGSYDGQEGVDFILEATEEDSIIVVAVGKLTNIALALKKEPSLAGRTKIVWLGSNYPEPGEYNQDNDTVAMNYVLNSRIPFEMVTVRYGKPSGTDAVSVTKTEINEKMPGLGPKATEPITGRHGGSFSTFGDYSISLFEHIFDHIGDNGPKNSRPLFDMVALAILKNNSWGETTRIPAPILIDNQWVDRPENQREIILWENFDKTGILDDFYSSLQKPVLVQTHH